MNSNRARQFMPFDALKGFKEALRKKEKVIVPKRELTNDDIDSLNYKFNQLRKGQIIKVVYYNGENYIEIEGMISKLDITNRVLSIVKTKIYFDDIYDISGKEIKEYKD